MTLRPTLCALMILAVLVGTPALYGADAQTQKAFDALYGDALREVNGTISKTDDVALADRILEGAAAAQATPKLQELMCDEAYKLGIRSMDGYETAAKAMLMLAEVAPKRAAEANQNLILVRQRQYSRARGEERDRLGGELLDTMLSVARSHVEAGEFDEGISYYRRAIALASMVRPDDRTSIAIELDRAMQRQRLTKQIALLRNKLEANPKDTTTAKLLVKLHVVDMDDPSGARFYAALTGDEKTKKLTPLATTPVDQVPADTALELGDWYRAWAAQATSASRPAMLTRAQGYYQRFLDQHTTEDLSRTRATLTLREVETALSKLSGTAAVKTTAAPIRASRYAIFNGRDLRGWHVKGDNDAFKVEDGELVAQSGQRGQWLLTDKTYRDFQLKFEFKLSKGAAGAVAMRAHDDSQVISMPVADDSNPGGRGFFGNFAKTGAILGRIDKNASLKPIGEWNTAEVQMKDLNIVIKINGQLVNETDLSDARRFGRQLGRFRNGFGRDATDAVRKSAQGSIGIEAGTGEIRYRKIELKPM